MMNLNDLTPGTRFTSLGVEYEFLRMAGESVQPRRNQWGRAEGGTYIADRVAVKVNKRHYGWRFSYVAFYKGTRVMVQD